MMEREYDGMTLSIGEMEGYLSRAYVGLIQNEIPFRRFPSVMLWGPPGVGKSQGVRKIAESIHAQTEKRVVVTDVRLLLFNPVDLRGIPTANEDKTLAVWLKPKIFEMEEDPEVINILFLDEISAAPPSVQAAAYQITLDRAIGEHKLPENCIVIAAGNRVSDKSVAYKMPKALANRLCHIDIKEDSESWHQWALKSGVHKAVTGFLNYNSTMLMDVENTRDENAFPTPRAWEMVSNILTYVSEDIPAVFPLIAGCVGTDAAYAFRSWCEIYKNLPETEDIFRGEQKGVPLRAETLYALISNMVDYATRNPGEEGIRNSIVYAEKLPDEFMKKLFRDYLQIRKIHPVLKRNRDYNDWMMRAGLEWEDYENDTTKNQSFKA